MYNDKTTTIRTFEYIQQLLIDNDQKSITLRPVRIIQEEGEPNKIFYLDSIILDNNFKVDATTFQRSEAEDAVGIYDLMYQKNLEAVQMAESIAREG